VKTHPGGQRVFGTPSAHVPTQDSEYPSAFFRLMLMLMLCKQTTVGRPAADENVVSTDVPILTYSGLVLRTFDNIRARTTFFTTPKPN